MADGIANHSVNPRAAGKKVRAVEKFYFIERNPARGCRGGDRGVSQRTSLPQCEDSRWQAGFSHGNSDKIFGASSEAQKPNAVLDAPSFRRNLHSIDAAVSRRVHGSRQVRRAIKVVHGK